MHAIHGWHACNSGRRDRDQTPVAPCPGVVSEPRQRDEHARREVRHLDIGIAATSLSIDAIDVIRYLPGGDALLRRGSRAAVEPGPMSFSIQS